MKEGDKIEVGKDHTAFEEVYGGERLTGHDPVKRNKKHVNSKEKAQNRRGRKTETTTLGMGEDNVPFSKWADKNKSRKNTQTWLLADVTHTKLPLPSRLSKHHDSFVDAGGCARNCLVQVRGRSFRPVARRWHRCRRQMRW